MVIVFQLIFYLVLLRYNQTAFKKLKVNGKDMRLPNQTRPIGKNCSWLTDDNNSNILRIPYCS